jgi:hypothetical protein
VSYGPQIKESVALNKKTMERIKENRILIGQLRI